MEQSAAFHLRQLVSVVFLLTATGCWAFRVPGPKPAERQRLAEPAIDLAVLVAPPRPESWRANVADYPAFAHKWSTRLASQLAGVFREVSLDSTAARPHLVVESAQVGCADAWIPLLTILTLGVVPTVGTTSVCDGMVFRRYGAQQSSDSMVVNVRTSSRTLLWLLAGPLAILPSWTTDGKARDRRHTENVRLAILARRTELRRLAQAP